MKSVGFIEYQKNTPVSSLAIAVINEDIYGYKEKVWMVQRVGYLTLIVADK